MDSSFAGLHAYDPSRDAAVWVAFCLAAHIHETQDRLDLLDQASQRWQALESLIAGRGWPDRLVIALEQALFDRCARADYAAEASISLPTAATTFGVWSMLAGWWPRGGAARCDTGCQRR